MERTRAILFVCFLFAIFCIAASMQAQRRFALPAPATKNEIERGRYLVEEIAKCTECHTPRKPNGELDGQAWLRGAPIWIRPVAPISNWADRAPALAGLPSFTEEQAEKVLENGTGPNGEELRPPMHIYHMAPADARAIIAYLKSLPAEVH
jgi:mono/diheme cytochrome c family protein